MRLLVSLCAALLIANLAYAAEENDEPAENQVYEMTAEQSDIVLTAPQLVGLPARHLRWLLPSGTLVDRTVMRDRATSFLVEYYSVDRNSRLVVLSEPPDLVIEKRRSLFPRDAEIVLGETGESNSKLTSFPWRRFRLVMPDGNGRDCIAFLRAFGPTTGARGRNNTRRIAGFYCSDRTLSFEPAWIQALFDGINVKK